MRRALVLLAIAACKGGAAHHDDAAPVVTPAGPPVACALAWRPTADVIVADTPVHVRSPHPAKGPSPRATVHAQVIGGVGRDVVVRKVEAQRAALLACYQDAMRRKPLAGTVDAALSIDPAGKVAHASVVGLDATMDACLTQAVSTIAFPRSGRGAEAHLSIDLRIENNDAGGDDDDEVDAGAGPVAATGWADLVWADDDPDPTLTAWASGAASDAVRASDAARCADVRARLAIRADGTVAASDGGCASLASLHLPPPPLPAALRCTIGAPAWTAAPGDEDVLVAPDATGVTIRAAVSVHRPIRLATPDGALISDLVPLGVGPPPSPRPHTALALPADPAAISAAITAAATCADCDHVLVVSLGDDATGAALASLAVTAHAAGLERLAIAPGPP